MERSELIAALRRMKAETGSLVCLGCGYENGCSVKGCALIRAAAEELEKTRWIPVAERLPDRDCWTAVITRKGGRLAVRFHVRRGTWAHPGARTAAFWMELPEIPEEVREDG